VEGLLAVVPARASLPAVIRNVRRVTTVVVDPAARVQMLGAAVSDDPALSAETLRLANAALMACAGVGRVDTVHQAILLLGFERVRDVAVGAAVFGMVDGDDPSLAELVGGAVITAHHALAIGARVRHPRPETAYLAGLLRNLGELAAARWLPGPYAAYRTAVRTGQAPSVAARTTLGATRDELGTALARHWGLPDPLRGTLGLGSGDDVTPDALLTPIARLAGRLTDAIYRSEPPATVAWGAVQEAAERLRVPQQTLTDIAEWAFAESTDALAALRPDLRLDAWGARLATVVGRDDPATASLGAEADPGRPRPSLQRIRGDDGSPDHAPDVVPMPSDWVFEETAEERAEAAERATADAVQLALRAMLEAGFQRAAFVLLDPATRALRVRYADGDGAEYLEHRIDTPIDGSTPLSRAYAQGTDIVAPTRLVLAQLDDPVCKRLRSVSFVWLPVRVAGTPIGALIGDALRTGLVPPEGPAHAATARDALARALDAMRQGR
jgi:hypothetical protein